jgi:hypothetical protein
MNIRAVGFAITLLFCLSYPLTAVEPSPQMVSIIQLIANPKDYDGKVVMITGFLTLEFEETVIYLHRDDSELGNIVNGVWVEVTDDFRKRRSEINNKYVSLVGRFDFRDKEGFGIRSASIGKISSIEVRMQRNRTK